MMMITLTRATEPKRSATIPEAFWAASVVSVERPPDPPNTAPRVKAGSILSGSSTPSTEITAMYPYTEVWVTALRTAAVWVPCRRSQGFIQLVYRPHPSDRLRRR
jgi:hypothetical protein